MTKTYGNNRIFTTAVYLLVLLTMFIAAAPFLWLVMVSITPLKYINTVPLQWIPPEVNLHYYADVLFGSAGVSDFFLSVLNSLTISSATVAVSLVFGSLGAYAFARLTFPFRDRLVLFVLFTQMIPGVAVLIPIYTIFKNIGMLDTKMAIALTNITYTLPFVIWVMRGYFFSIPKELEDAAFIDGTGRLGALFRVVLPISTPGLFATGVFVFLNSWNEFTTALTLSSSIQSQTIPVVINFFAGRYTSDYSLMGAAGVIGCLPPILLSLFFQRYLIDGLASGSLKG